MTREQWSLVRDVFNQALELPPDRRVPTVRERCTADDEVRAEVESLLAAHSRADGFLSDSPICRSPDAAEDPQLAAGSRLGQYEIEALAASGGMGEIYRARDLRLDRHVAVKVLSSGMAGDAWHHERFHQEARLLSKLAHPHICTLHDVGTVDHASGRMEFLVMELLEGETLAARLRRGPIPIAQTLVLAIQIADALAEAHAVGIVHRDLKPGNVMLTRSGVKLIDFGLSQLRQQAPAPPSSSLDPAPGTSILVGTLPYMAPEQVRGVEADARADLFAFGTILYEMVAGARPFTGDSPAELAAAILEREPVPLRVRQPHVSPALDRLVLALLAKDPAERWQTARDLRRELKWLHDNDEVKEGTAHPPAHRGWAVASAAILALGIAAAIGYVAYSTRAVAGPDVANVTFPIHPPEGARFPRGAAEMAISPDAARLVFVALTADGVRHLWVRDFDSVNARLLGGTEGAFSPFWSPDGQSVAFFSDGTLKRIPAAGGLAQVICERRGFDGGGGSWNRDGTIVFGSFNGPIHRVPDTGGVPTAVTALDASRREHGHMWPTFLPDGRRFVYTRRSLDRPLTGIYLGSLDSRQADLVQPAESGPALAGDYLVWLAEGQVRARSFDPDRASLVGKPIVVEDRIVSDGPLRSGAPIAAGGAASLAYRSASADSRLVWLDRQGHELSAFPAASDYHHPWLSPDETRVAVEKTDPATAKHTIWVLDLARGITSRLVADAAGAHGPVWSPDGRRVLFGSNRLGGLDLFAASANGQGGDELLLASNEKTPLESVDWSDDGRLLMYQTARRDLFVFPLTTGATAGPFIATAANERQGTFSPDVRFVAYTSDESGSNEVYVRRYPEADHTWQVSAHGGAQARWRRDGKELFFLSPDGTLMAADVRVTGASLETGVPRALFKTGITSGFLDRRNQYLATRDGQRFLVNISVEDEGSAPITVVLNWRPPPQD